MALSSLNSFRSIIASYLLPSWTQLHVAVMLVLKDTNSKDFVFGGV
jgi:hypothetical protein